jgi:hypothetical protein
MRRCCLLAFLALAAVAGPAAAQSFQLDQDQTIVADCARLPADVSIPAFAAVRESSCRKVTGALQGARIKDLRLFQKAGAALSLNKCGPDGFEDSLAAVLEIVRLRGLQARPDLWLGTVNLVARACRVHGTQVGDIVAWLKAAGPKAAQLSDAELEAALSTAKTPAAPVAEPGKAVPKNQ